MTTLTDFLLDRLDDDERTALYAQDRPGPGHNEAPGGYGGWWLGHYQHARRFDPARVLEEVEAKRQIVKVHDGWHVCAYNDPKRGRGTTDFDDGDGSDGMDACPTLAALALPFSDHPDYRPEWKP